MPRLRLPSGLIIRHAAPADADAVTRLFSAPGVVRGTLQLPFPSPELWRRRLSDPPPGLVSLLACARGEPVGILGIHTELEFRRRHAAHLGMGVRDDWQRRGVGAALLRTAVEMADRWLNLERLELHVYVDNAPAIRLYRRFNFETEGTLRRYAFCDGRFVDAFLMARLRPA